MREKRDNYNIEENWGELKELIRDYHKIENDLQSFLYRGNKKAAKRLRWRFLYIYQKSLKLRKSILYQNKENSSDYEKF